LWDYGVHTLKGFAPGTLKGLSSVAWSPERIEKEVEVTREAERTGRRRSESVLMLHDC
jgi:hypothetical protein